MFTSIKQYTDSIARFRPKYDEETCKRMGRAEGLILSIFQSINTQMMMLDMLKANVFYNKPVHECIEARMTDAEYTSATTQTKAIFWHGLLGILTECYEIYLESQTKGFAKINGVGEIGDLGWFLNELAISFRTSLLQAFNVNEAKLDARYGEAFTTGKAVARNKIKEELRMSIALEQAKKLEAGDVPEGKVELVFVDKTPKGWRGKFEKTFVMSGMSSDKPELLFRVWDNGSMSIALPEHVMQFIETEILGEYDPDTDYRNEEKRLLAQSLPALEEAARHNASNSQRITAARIREILGLEPYHYKNGKNYNGKGEEVDRSGNPVSLPAKADAGQAADSGGRPPEPESEQLPQ